MLFDRDNIECKLARLAAEEGVLIGTSSWKYPSWRGMLYNEARYVWRGKFAESRFEKNCLAEYAEVFKTGNNQRRRKRPITTTIANKAGRNPIDHAAWSIRTPLHIAPQQ